ncbi:MAG: gfo/Idh/MocA family oxidoreductase, partial [Verrucomicrobiae bacterium]|nr:gfo/Idh/MocA family oxidoreductase [Verrucomicrobiae bacterium]
VSHNVWEGRQAVNAALKYSRIVQAGTQSRSSHGIREAVEFVQKGGLGRIVFARGLCYKPRGSIGKCEGEQRPPAEVDYDLWSGPAPILPIRRLRFHYDWHWIWAYGNGDLGNQGIHQMDIARWFLGEPELSPRVMSIGGRFGYEDDGETPNTQIVFHEFERAPLFFEVRGLPSRTGSKNMDKYWPVPFTPPEPALAGEEKSKDKEKGAKPSRRTPGDPRPSVGVVIHCENGFVSVPGYSSATAFDNKGKLVKEFKGSEDHFANCIKAVRSRKPGDLNAPILDGHLSSALCHTGNISHLVGRQAAPDEIAEQIKGDKEAAETFGRFKEHLAANGVDLTKTKATLGAWLKMDPKTERFIGNDKANALLTRNYRKPFVVPEIKT